MHRTLRLLSFLQAAGGGLEVAEASQRPQVWCRQLCVALCVQHRKQLSKHAWPGLACPALCCACRVNACPAPASQVPGARQADAAASLHAGFSMWLVFLVLFALQRLADSRLGCPTRTRLPSCLPDYTCNP